jgi:hypothetical protein
MVIRAYDAKSLNNLPYSFFFANLKSVSWLSDPSQVLKFSKDVLATHKPVGHSGVLGSRYAGLNECSSGLEEHSH